MARSNFHQLWDAADFVLGITYFIRALVGRCILGLGFCEWMPTTERHCLVSFTASIDKHNCIVNMSGRIEYEHYARAIRLGKSNKGGIIREN